MKAARELGQARVCIMMQISRPGDPSDYSDPPLKTAILAGVTARKPAGSRETEKCPAHPCGN